MSLRSQLDSAPSASIDPVAHGMTAEGIDVLCSLHLERAAVLRERVKGLAEDAELSWETVLQPLDALGLETALAAGFAELMAETHPDAAVREAARGCRPRVTQFYTDLLLDGRLAAVVRRYAETRPHLEPARQRFLDELLRDFRRNGLELDEAGQGRLRELNERLSALGQEFSRNIAEAVEHLEVDATRLAGLPESFLASRPTNERGQVTLTTTMPDYFPVLSYCDDRGVAAALYELYDQRAAEKNVPILEEVLQLRQEKAELLGYDTWASFSVEPKMARTPAAVRGFLDEAANAVTGPAGEELKLFAQEHAALGLGDGAAIPVFDRLYIQNKLGERRFGFDARRLSDYFEVTAVVDGALRLVRTLFGVDLLEVAEAPRWHEEVRAFDVVEGGTARGRLYLDLHPRPNKYQHAAMFEVRPGCQADDGYVAPITALVCNFPRPGAGPALLTHEDVVTFFHELGHALHHLLTRQPLASFSGTNTAHDFVEVPSQVFEEWAWRRETLDSFARHHQSGEPIPSDLFEAMTRARTFGRALAVERQLAYATLDFEYHTRRPPLDTSRVLQEVMKDRQSFQFPDNSRFHAAFGHLMGYDAGYYGYQWSLAIAQDVLTRFEAEGFLSEATARDYRREILEPGGGLDEASLVARFLGRETNLEAYGRYLAGQ